MNPELKQQIKLPTINWDRALKWSIAGAIMFTTIALISRARSIILLAGFLDVLLVVGCIAVAVVSLIAKSDNNDK